MSRFVCDVCGRDSSLCRCSAPTRPRSSSLAATRRLTTLKLAGLELPSCWAAATVSAAVNAIDRSTVSAKASRRRLVTKALRVSGAV